MKTKLNERFLLMHVQFSEDLSGIKEMLVLEYLLSVPQQKWKIQENRKPVTVDEKQDGKEGVDSGFRDDVRVEAVAEVNRVDVVTFQIAVHDGEEDLKKQVDSVYQNCQQIEPCFARHVEIDNAVGAICTV